MIRRDPSFTIQADPSNPGQFFACCGILELSQRLWPDAEGWFDCSGNNFNIATDVSNVNAEIFVTRLKECKICGLTDEERSERITLERKKIEMKQLGALLSKKEEERLGELGANARSGLVYLDAPFCLTLDWWQAGEDERTPKTWAGRQEIHRVARSAQEALSNVADCSNILDFGCILRVPKEYQQKASDGTKSVEPFYFDARRFASALNTGFSLDRQNAETTAYPAVELLCLAGLQRFRPSGGQVKWTFGYRTWSIPLKASVAAAVVCGAVPIHAFHGYRFSMLFRDDQKRYKAFGFATPTGGLE